MEMDTQSYMKKERNMKSLTQKRVNVVCTHVNIRWIALIIIRRINLCIMRLNRAAKYQNAMMTQRLHQQR